MPSCVCRYGKGPGQLLLVFFSMRRVQTHDSSGGEFGELEDSHGSIPDDSLGVSQGLVEDVEGLGANIQTHPVIGDRVDVDGLGRGAWPGSEMESNPFKHLEA